MFAGETDRRWTALVALLVGSAIVAIALATSSGAQAQDEKPPTPEVNFAGEVVGSRPCAYDVKDARERRFYEIEGWSAPSYERYPGNCRRLKFSYGPIAVKPGQND